MPRLHVNEHESGQALVEYALVLSLVALVCVGSLSALGLKVQDMFAPLLPPGL
jgi:Flp pilus assembly pilin Flp